MMFPDPFKEAWVIFLVTFIGVAAVLYAVLYAVTGITLF